MTTVYDVPANKLITKVAEKLKKFPELKKPSSLEYVKTGVSRERRPDNPDWWYVRCASVLRKIYIHGPVGIESLRTAYGGRKSRGSRPEHFRKGSGKIIRTIVQGLEKLGFLEKVEGKGRKITNKGKSFLDRAAHEVKLQMMKTT